MAGRCDDCDRRDWVWTLEPTSAWEGGQELCASCLSNWIRLEIATYVSSDSYILPVRLAHVHCDSCHGDNPSLVATIPWVWTAPNGTSECAECVAERLGGRPGLFSSAWRQALAREQAFLSA